MDVENALRLIPEKTQQWMRDLIRLLSNILLARIVLLTGLIIARWIRKITTGLVKKFSHNNTPRDLS